MTPAEYLNNADNKATTLICKGNWSDLQDHLVSIREDGFGYMADRWDLLTESDGTDRTAGILKALRQVPAHAPASAYWPYIIAARWSWNFVLARYTELLSRRALFGIEKKEICNYKISSALHMTFIHGLSLTGIESLVGDRLWVQRRLQGYRKIRHSFRSDAPSLPRLSLHVPMDSSEDTNSIRHIMSDLAEALRSEGIAFETWAQSIALPALPSNSTLPSISYHTISGLAPSSLFHMKSALYPDLIALDSCGYSGWSELADLQAIPTLSVAQREKAISLRQKEVTKYKQKDGTAPTGDIFVALQTIPDSAQRHAHISMLEMLDRVCAWGERNNLCVIVKRHPKCMSRKVTEAMARMSKDVIVTDASIFDLFHTVRIVVTVNSAVGFEAAVAGLPVVTCGASEYRLAAYEADDLLSIEGALEAGLRDGPPRMARDFVDYYLGAWAVNKEDVSSRIIPSLIKTVDS